MAFFMSVTPKDGGGDALGDDLVDIGEGSQPPELLLFLRGHGPSKAAARAICVYLDAQDTDVGAPDAHAHLSQPLLAVRPNFLME
ncbi:hypothetical protein MDA_GLEAN10001628 [Myotis davidii]|uniref:Uncharacterized protein n=1 Tax=Myotis davidii TaxID=225400 RepID=L5LIU1_MYODS|nr:hypothetical protein MDA_GLEAN10001628 [Myotis davidii]